MTIIIKFCNFSLDKRESLKADILKQYIDEKEVNIDVITMIIFQFINGSAWFYIWYKYNIHPHQLKLKMRNKINIKTNLVNFFCYKSKIAFRFIKS